MWYSVKCIITVALVLAISELAKLSKPIAAFLASLPLVSILAMIWMHVEGEDRNSLCEFSYNVFYLVLPSLLLFLLFPLLLNHGFGFSLALGLACCVTAGAYLLMAMFLS